MKTLPLLTPFILGVSLIMTPGNARYARADQNSHPVFKENPGKHKGWDKHDKNDKDEAHDRRYYHVPDTRHEHMYPRTVTRTATGYWHRHDGYPRHFHYYRTPAPLPPHRRVHREVVVIEKPVPVYKPVVRRDGRMISDTHKAIQNNRDQLSKQHAELRKDRAELRRDIRSGASKDEIRNDRKEIRDDWTQIHNTRREIASDKAKLEAARRK